MILSLSFVPQSVDCGTKDIPLFPGVIVFIPPKNKILVGTLYVRGQGSRYVALGLTHWRVQNNAKQPPKQPTNHSFVEKDVPLEKERRHMKAV